MKKNISDIVLERYVLGELPSEQMRAISAAIESDETLRIRVNEIRSSDDEIREKYPFEVFAAKIGRSRKGAAGKKYSLRKMLVPATSACVLLLAFGIYKTLPVFYSPYDDTTLVKGGEASLLVYKFEEKRPEIIESGAHAAPGDLLQLGFVVSKPVNCVIFSIDGNRKVTLHYPYEKKLSTRIESAGKAMLKESYELDDAPSFERFFIVTSETDFTADEIIGKAADFAAGSRNIKKETLVLGESFNQDSMLVIKE